jgi:hypothetical protein
VLGPLVRSLQNYSRTKTLYTVGRASWEVDQPCRKAAIYTGPHGHRRNADRHPYLEWDSNPRSQCSRGERYFLPSLFMCLINKHVFVRMGKKCTPASGSYTLPRRTRPKRAATLIGVFKSKNESKLQMFGNKMFRNKYLDSRGDIG